MKTEEQAATPFAGGIMQHGFQCGMIWGATLAAGAQAYKLYGPYPQAETKAIIAAQKLVEIFRADKNAINCSDITDIDKSSTTMQMIMYFLIKGGTIGCMRLASRYAPLAFDQINSSLAEDNKETSSYPVSCAAMLAQKMGVSDKHTVMAAGLAGGIGLCGGACGALGTAIWIMELKRNQEGNGKIDFNDPKALELIERFLQCTDYEFECSEIVGRKFENVEDHAKYLHEGGCSKIIEVLASA
jgi:Putative redox-active protein (C_GCAxxG_C_C)